MMVYIYFSNAFYFSKLLTPPVRLHIRVPKPITFKIQQSRKKAIPQSSNRKYIIIIITDRKLLLKLLTLTKKVIKTCRWHVKFDEFKHLLHCNNIKESPKYQTKSLLTEWKIYIYIYIYLRVSIDFKYVLSSYLIHNNAFETNR